MDTHKSPRLTLSMIVKNEEHRYLRRVLTAAKEYISDAVIIDDGSEDNTVSLCKEILSPLPVRLIENQKSSFHTEWKLRYQQWTETIATNPDWILSLDADEIFEDKFKDGIRGLIEQDEYDMYVFRLYDFWDEEHYRDDELWSAHHRFYPFLLRYKKDFNYTFKKTDQHCGRFPKNVWELPYSRSYYRLKHYGWASEEIRKQKYSRYKELDPEGKYGLTSQYSSILDPNPNLIKWIE